MINYTNITCTLFNYVYRLFKNYWQLQKTTMCDLHVQAPLSTNLREIWAMQIGDIETHKKYKEDSL